jgi:hypothetical protein
MNNSSFKRKNYRCCSGLWILVRGKKGVVMANVEYKVMEGAEKEAEPLLDETEDQYQERVAVLCLRELFVRTQLPRSITENIWEVVERHGVWAAFATAKLVVDAFEAGKGSDYSKERTE